MRGMSGYEYMKMLDQIILKFKRLRLKFLMGF